MANSEAALFPKLQDTAKVLAISRIMVAWQPVGIAAGVFDMCARYTGERQQFGAALGAFQLVQERLARMLGNVQAMFLMCWRLSKLYEQVRTGGFVRGYSGIDSGANSGQCTSCTPNFSMANAWFQPAWPMLLCQVWEEGCTV